MEYLAHISEDGERTQTLDEHCKGVAELAAEFASAFDAKSWGYCAGIMHDIGKGSKEFQEKLIHRGSQRVDHSSAGAKELLGKKGYYLLAYCVAGHHAGLPDMGTDADTSASSTLSGRKKKPIPDYHEYAEKIDIPSLEPPKVRLIGKGGFSVSFFIRMIYSCLVDADFLDTEDFMRNGKTDRQPKKLDSEMLKVFEKHIAPWLENTDTNTINGRRTEILKAAMDVGVSGKTGIYSMTVPTGGGKTTASLGFGLTHAIERGKDRIIYVIPYTSIIEQNAGVFRDILGAENVLENHSNVDYGDSEELKPMQLATENWDKPVVVTTNVQFFESLFSNKTSKCRKLHNMANSVIIFDEAQMLPTQYLIPCCRAMEELATNYNSTIVLCTATQPSLQKFFVNAKVQEICPRVKEQFDFFKRTEVTNIGVLKEGELIEKLSCEHQTLCICNSRKRVQKIYKEVKDDGVYHLSTLMYPEHRRRKLAEIRERLTNGKKCIVIATSLVEAGVDLDFQTVYRELAGVDSDIQAAGRCNREGKRNLDESKTYIFEFEEKMGVAPEIKLPIGIAGRILEEYDDLSSLDAIQSYFEELHDVKGSQLDRDMILNQFEEKAKQGSYPFATVAKNFKLIEQNTKMIIIETDESAENIARLKRGEHSRKLIREVGHYGVQVYERDYERLCSVGMLEVLEQWNGQIAVLKDPNKYSDDMGLIIDVEIGDAAFM